MSSPAIVANLRSGASLTVRGLVKARAGPRLVVQGARSSHITTVTLMDENEDTVNLLIWSNTEGEAGVLEQMAKVGAVLDVVKPAIVALSGQAVEKNDPVTSSRLRLKFVTAKSLLKVVKEPEASVLAHLVMVPYKAAGLPSLALQDIRAPERRAQFVTILAAVQCVMPEVVTNGQTVREVRLFDCDTATAVLKLWEPEQRRVASSWVPRHSVLLLSNVLIEFDVYRGINVLAGSSRSVITTDPDMWEARKVRQHAQVATMSSLDRLRTYVGGSIFTPASHRAVTVSQLQDLGQQGARTEAESLQLFSITGKVSKTTLLEPDAVMATCKGCGDIVTHFFEDYYDCNNFSCQAQGIGTSKLAYNVKAGISDETGTLTDLEVMAPFLQHALRDPAVWAEQDSLVRDTTARLFLQGFVRFYLAVELPLANHGRPLRIAIVSVE